MARESRDWRAGFLIARLDKEPSTRAEVEAARAWSVPRSVFLGRVVSAGEPLWTVADRRWALALIKLEGDLHSCGHSMRESFDPELSSDWIAKTHRCYACKAAQAEADEWNALASADPPGADVKGLSYSAVRRSEQLHNSKGSST